MADKGSKTTRGKSLSDELLKDDFFKPPVDEIMDEDVSAEASEGVLPADEVPEEPDVVSAGGKSDQGNGVPVKYLIIGGAGLLVIVALVLLYFLVLSGPKIQPEMVPPAGTVPVAQVPAQPPAPAPVAPPVAQPSAPAPAPTPPASQPAAPSEPASPPPAPAPAAKPKPELKPEPKPVQVAAVPRFTLSLGIFTNEADQKASQAKVKSLGWETVSQEKTVTAEKYFIFLNEKLTPGQAKANSLKLKMLQRIENEIIPQADGTAQVRVGPFPDKNQAKQTLDKMNGAGFPSEIQAEQTQVKSYALKTGRFATREEANKAVSTLKQKGLKAEIVNLE